MLVSLPVSSTYVLSHCMEEWTGLREGHVLFWVLHCARDRVLHRGCLIAKLGLVLLPAPDSVPYLNGGSVGHVG